MMNNTEQIILDAIQRQANVNPMAQNVLNMYQNHDSKGLWDFVGNVCKENGITVQEAIQKAIFRK